MRTQPNFLQIMGTLVIDYFRWSQLAPMILMWAAMLGMLFALLFISNQEATFTLVERMAQWVSNLPWIGPRFVEWIEAQSQDGAVDVNLGAIDFKAVVLRTWALVSAIFMAFAWLASRLLGPFKPWTLKRKLASAAMACLLIVVVFMILYFLDHEAWNDSPFQAMLSGTHMALVMFVVSAWCLSVSHALGWLSSAVATADFSKATERVPFE